MLQELCIYIYYILDILWIGVCWVFVTPPSWPFGILGPVRSARSTYRQRTAARRHGRLLVFVTGLKVWQTWCTVSNSNPWITPPNSTLCQAFRWRQPSYNALLEAIRLHCRCGRAGRVWRFVKNPGSFSIAMSDCDDGKKREQQLHNHQFCYGWICLHMELMFACTKAVTDLYSGNALRGSQRGKNTAKYDTHTEFPTLHRFESCKDINKIQITCPNICYMILNSLWCSFDSMFALQWCYKSHKIYTSKVVLKLLDVNVVIIKSQPQSLWNHSEHIKAY